VRIIIRFYIPLRSHVHSPSNNASAFRRAATSTRQLLPSPSSLPRNVAVILSPNRPHKSRPRAARPSAPHRSPALADRQSSTTVHHVPNRHWVRLSTVIGRRGSKGGDKGRSPAVRFWLNCFTLSFYNTSFSMLLL